jgi:hypothetical protein
VYVDKQGWPVVESSGDRAVPYVGMNPDETMARPGITAGPSGGGRLTGIALYRNGRLLRADSPTLCVSGLDGWFFAIRRNRVTVAP